MKNSPEGQLNAMEDVAIRMGCRPAQRGRRAVGTRRGILFSPGYVETGSYPGFPTDLQSPLLVAMALADGESRLKETIFNDRFVVVAELNRRARKLMYRITSWPVFPAAEAHRQTGDRRELRGGAALVVAGAVCGGSYRSGKQVFY